LDQLDPGEVELRPSRWKPQPGVVRCDHWRKVNAPELVAVVRAGAIFRNRELLERPVEVTPAESPPTQTITAQSGVA
jgi:hypothetical protein